MDQQSGPGGSPAPQKPTPAQPRPTTFWLVLPLIVAFVMAVFFLTGEQAGRSHISYGFFLEQLNAGNIEEARHQRPQDSRHVQGGSEVSERGSRRVEAGRDAAQGFLYRCQRLPRIGPG